MKTIEPVQVWYNGQEVNATVLNAYATDVQLNVSANFYYTLSVVVNEYNYPNQVNGGMLKMEGQAYQDWDQDTFAWDWVASQLNLTIIGDVTTTTTSTTTTEAPSTTTTTLVP
jgi:hypothetical protein